MKKSKLLILMLFISMTFSCQNNQKPKNADDEIWKLGWRMIENSMEEKYVIAESQFDSLINMGTNLELKFIISGLEILDKLDKNSKLVHILKNQPANVLSEICSKGFLKDKDTCKEHSIEQVKNKELQLKLIQMYLEDQAVRGNIMEEIIVKYEIDRAVIVQYDAKIVDERNRNGLKEIFKEFGFPNKKLVGRDAMNGIFIMIQHSTGDKDWQKSQLPNIKNAVNNGDMDGENYAYLYDRIKFNSGEKQLYGTQFSKVDPVSKTVELAETEDIENLDKRRREYGLMPIEMYKRFMLKNN